jgi:hypothetical protein
MLKKQVKPIFVQVKNPHDPTTELTASKYGLDSMVVEANNRCIELGIDPYTGGKANFSIDLVTYGKGLKRYTKEVKFRHIPVREIGHQTLTQYFGKGNPVFWNRAYEMVAESQPTVGPGKILHTCQNKDNNWPLLFKDTRSVDELNRKHFKLLKKLEEEGGLAMENYKFPNRVGDLLELFTVCMYRLSETNVKFGVVDYKQIISDNGLDGEGWVYL